MEEIQLDKLASLILEQRNVILERGQMIEKIQDNFGKIDTKVNNLIQERDDLQAMLKTERETNTNLQVELTKIKYENEQFHMKYNILNTDYSELLKKYEGDLSQRVLNPLNKKSVDDTILEFRELFKIILGRLRSVETDVIVLKIPKGKEYKYI